MKFKKEFERLEILDNEMGELQKSKKGRVIDLIIQSILFIMIVAVYVTGIIFKEITFVAVFGVLIGILSFAMVFNLTVVHSINKQIHNTEKEAIEILNKINAELVKDIILDAQKSMIKVLEEIDKEETAKPETKLKAKKRTTNKKNDNLDNTNQNNSNK